MDEGRKYLLLKNWRVLLEDLHAESVLPYLISDLVFAPNESQVIESKATDFEKARSLLEILLKKGNTGWESFLNSLKCTGYEHLFVLLNDTAGKEKPRPRRMSSAEMKILLHEGGVPTKPQYFVERPTIITELRRQLKELSEKEGWLVVHGMGGSGKTVLVAEAVKDKDLISYHFPGGVIWLSVGQTDKESFLTKVQNLCARLDNNPNVSTPANLEAARDKLRKLFLEKYPKSLLVVDAVWDDYVTKCIETHLRVLITTRKEALANRLHGNVIKCRTPPCLSRDESDQLLSSCTGLPIERLPPQGQLLYKLTDGLPMILSIVGNLLSQHPNRWSYYCEKIQQRQLGRIKSYASESNNTLTDMIEMSVDNLPSEVKDKYQMLAVFNDNCMVPSQVLSVLWDEPDVEVVEDIMLVAVEHSLAFRQQNESGLWSYFLHSMHSRYLKQRLSAADIKSLNVTLICNYEKRCGGRYDHLPNDGYIFWYLPYHLVRAHKTREMCETLLDLRFIHSKLQARTSIADTLSDYVKYIKIFEMEGYRQHRDDMYDFLSANVHLVNDAGNQIVALQIALMEQVSSSVYSQALSLTSLFKEGGGHSSVAGDRPSSHQDQDQSTAVFFEWCNKAHFRRPKHSSIKLSDPIKNLSLSPHGQRVVAGVTDNSDVKVVKVETGEELLDFSATDDESSSVLAFSFITEFNLMTVHSDAKLKIWSLPTSIIASAAAATTHSTITPETEDHSPLLDEFGDKPFACQMLQEVDMSTVIREPLSASILARANIVLLWDDEHILVYNFQEDRQLSYRIGKGICEVLLDDDLEKLLIGEGSVMYVTSMENSSVLAAYDQHSSNIIGSTIHSPTALVATCDVSHIHIWSIADGSQQHKLKPESWVCCLSFSPSGHLVIAGLSSYSIELWSAATGDWLSSYKGHMGWVYSALVSQAQPPVTNTTTVEGGSIGDADGGAGGQNLISSADDAILKVWDLQTDMAAAMSFKPHFATSFGLASTADCSSPIPSSSTHSSQPMSESGASTQYESSEEENSLLRVDDDLLIVASDNRNHLNCISGMEGNISCRSDDSLPSALSAINLSLCASTTASLDLTNSHGGSGAGEVLTGAQYGSKQLNYSYLVAAGCANGAIQVFRYDMGGCSSSSSSATSSASSSSKLAHLSPIYESLNDHSDQITSISFVFNNTQLITSSHDKTLMIHHLTSTTITSCLLTSSKTAPVLLGKHSGPIIHLKLYDHKTKAMSAARDGTIKLWDLRKLKCIESIDAHRDWIIDCDIDDRQDYLASTSNDKTAKIWRLKGGIPVATITVHEDSVRSCAFSRCSTPQVANNRRSSNHHHDRLLATGDDRGVICIWHIANSTCLYKFIAHDTWVTQISFDTHTNNFFSVGENISWWNIKCGSGSAGKSDLVSREWHAPIIETAHLLQSINCRGSSIDAVQFDSASENIYSRFVAIDSSGCLYILRRI